MSSDSSNPWAGSYAAKSNQPCPSTLVRTFDPSKQTVSPGEANYIAERQKLLPKAWSDWLGDASQLGYNLTEFLEADVMPRVGLACSGGGFRASLYCAGILNAYDARNDTAQRKGTGGLLQVSSYFAGVSGGSWTASSLAYNSFPPLHSLVFGDSSRDLPGWLLDLDIAIPDGINILNTKNQHYYGTVLSSVYAKASSGFDTSITDPWARLISFHFLNGTTRDNFFTNDSSHGAGLLWSDLPSSQALSSFEMPLPMAVMNSQPGTETGTTNRPPLNAVVYEVTPWEMGSFDPSLSAMMNVKYLGTKLVRGQPDNDTACVEEFDQAGFVIGSASSLFNIALDRAANIIDGFDEGPGKAIVELLNRLIARFTTRKDDVANWPNPFNGLAPASFKDTDQTWLNLVDGGENAANVPIEQLLVKPREVDVVVAIDTTGETTLGAKDNWPNGTAIRTSRSRVTTLLSLTHQGFPQVPDDFAKTGVNLRTTFFGCEPSRNPPEFPLIVYVPNSPPFGGGDPVTNSGSFKTSYSAKHQELFFDQTFDIASAGFLKGTNDADVDFPKCLQCAVIDRARYRVKKSSVEPDLGGQSTPAGSSSSPTPTSSSSSSLSSSSSSSVVVRQAPPGPSQTPTSPSDGPLPRSSFCSQCFQKYCFDPDHPPTNADFPNRKFLFVSPDPPSALSKAEDFLKKHGVQLAIGLGVGIICSIIACAVFAIIRRRRRIKRQRAAKMANVTYMPIYDDANAWDNDGRMSYEHEAATGGYSSQQYEMAGMSGAAGTMGGYNDPYKDIDSPPGYTREPSPPPVAPGSLPAGAAAPVVVAHHHHDTSGGGGSVGD